jgi:hypothetical protein
MDWLLKKHDCLGIISDDERICVQFVDPNDGTAGLIKAITRAPEADRDTCAALIHTAACTYWHLTLDKIREQNFYPTIALLEGAQGALPRLKSFVCTCLHHVRPAIPQARQFIAPRTM